MGDCGRSHCRVPGRFAFGAVDERLLRRVRRGVCSCGFALVLPHYCVLGVLVVAGAAGAAWWSRQRGGLRALLAGAAASASAWVVLLLGSRALADF